MTIEILKSRYDISLARKQLKRLGLSCIPSWPKKTLINNGIINGVNVGDRIKSWDVLKTVEIIQENISPSSRILDIGAYGSEILCILHRLNYTSLTGIDLNTNIKKMPYSHAIRYVVSDFNKAPFSDNSFEVITAMSVIEHGFQGDKLLKEIYRLLDKGGYFILSFDYWPDKIDTSEIKIFGMDWKIFSTMEVKELINDAILHGLYPLGTIDLSANDRIINFKRKKYTFAWGVLKKT
jgi:SAM-dependent methyltransferase